MTLKTHHDNAPRAAGFSLIELMAALAIMSIVLLACFQSISTWARLSARVKAASDNAIGAVMDATQFQQIVGGLTPAWPENEAFIFKGDARGWSGLSASPLEAIEPSMVFLRVQIVEADDGAALRYRSDNEDWLLATFSEEARFSYLGADGAWRSAWPPQAVPLPGPFDDAAFLTTPQTPLAIRLSTPSRSWIAAVRSTPRLPVREQDVTGFQ